MPEFIIAIQALIIVSLVGFMLRQQAQLFRAAMSRTPGEFRAAEKAARKPVPAPEFGGTLDEATALVLESVSAGNPMPHGLGGA